MNLFRSLRLRLRSAAARPRTRRLQFIRALADVRSAGIINSYDAVDALFRRLPAPRRPVPPMTIANPSFGVATSGRD